MNLRQIEIGALPRQPWKTTIGDQAVTIPYQITAGCIKLIERWASIFPREDTFVQQQFGVPSLMVRIDCAPNQDSLGVYEIEERPAGIGANTLYNNQFCAALARVREDWPKVTAVVSDLRRGGDDYLWIEELPLADALAHRNNDARFLVRAEPEEVSFHALASQSVSTVRMKGMKSYGVPLGLWNEVRWTDVCSHPDAFLPWGGGFCLKPAQGSKCRGVEVWHPAGSRAGGGATKTRILRTLAERGMMYLQPLIQPMRWEINNKPYDVIFRIYFAYQIAKAAWVSLGGSWNARPAPCCRIHGAEDAIFGPAILQE